jgi:hypothetical protein
LAVGDRRAGNDAADDPEGDAGAIAAGMGRLGLRRGRRGDDADEK